MDELIARIDLINEDALVRKVDKIEYFTFLNNSGIPKGVITRLEAIWDYSKKLGRKIIHIGRIIISKIVQFIFAHQNTFIGIAIAIALRVLLSSIPWLNVIIDPVLKLLGLYLAGKGMQIDYGTDSMIDAVYSFARDLWKTLAEILKILRNNLVEA